MGSTSTNLCNAVEVIRCKLYNNGLSKSLFSSVSSTILKLAMEFCKIKVQQHIVIFRTQGLLVLLKTQFPYSVIVKQNKPQGRVFV